MRVLDLFSGIGAFSLGLERAGMQTVAFCEIEPFCRRVLAKHWPEVTCYDDVCTLNADRLRADGIAVDVICGGFPCQDISVAGKGAGIGGARSGLWLEYARLIRELRPRWVVIENVAALLGRGLDAVLGDLAALGYDAEWHCIPASAVGAPHRRDRIWIVAYPGNGRHGEHVQSIGQSRRGYATDIRGDGEVRFVAYGTRERCEQQHLSEPEGWQPNSEAIGHRPDVAHSASARCGAGPSREGEPPRHEARRTRLNGLGGDVENSEHSGRGGREATLRERPPGAIMPSGDGLAVTCRPRLQIGPGTIREWAHQAAARGGIWDAQPRMGGEVDGPATGLYGVAAWEQDTPRTVGQGYPDRRQRLIALGNSIVPQIPEMIGRAIMQAEQRRGAHGQTSGA